MAERPILFSAPMVRAILAGTKLQTRRAIKAAHPEWIKVRQRPIPDDDGRLQYGWDGNRGSSLRCPYGQPGDRLWVRETHMDLGACYLYRADPGAEDERAMVAPGQRWKPAIHMPRAASRITLEITGVRVERLQDISEADALAEGCHGPDEDTDSNLPACPQCGGVGLYTAFNLATGGALPDTDCRMCDTSAKRYRLLWDQINGAGSWESNPWVWVVEFGRAEEHAHG